MSPGATCTPRHLPRLPPEAYRGAVWVHWTMNLERRATGWLDGLFHARLREWLVHALGRHRLVCPAYCVMPDHAHFLWAGLEPASDQRRAVQLLRTCWNRELRPGGRELQRQAHDHILRADERRRDAVAATAAYILSNPVRATLVADWRDYPYCGAAVPGYPSLDPRRSDHWAVFWRIYAGVESDEGRAANA
jgi:putative transposase